MVTPIVKTIIVACDPARAFDIFVSQTARWWPLDRHAVSAMSGAVAQSVVIEGKPGGAVYEIMADGSRSDWGIVTDIKPGAHITMTWHPGGSPEAATEVSVSFTPLDSGKTEVTLVHSHWDRLGDKAAGARESYGSGWVYVFETCYLAACA